MEPGHTPTQVTVNDRDRVGRVIHGSYVGCSRCSFDDPRFGRVPVPWTWAEQHDHTGPPPASL